MAAHIFPPLCSHFPLSLCCPELHPRNFSTLCFPFSVIWTRIQPHSKLMVSLFQCLMASVYLSSSQVSHPFPLRSVLSPLFTYVLIYHLLYRRYIAPFLSLFFFFSIPSACHLISGLPNTGAIKSSLITPFSPQLIHLPSSPSFPFLCLLPSLVTPPRRRHTSPSHRLSPDLVRGVTLPRPLSTQLAFLIFIFYAVCLLITITPPPLHPIPHPSMLPPFLSTLWISPPPPPGKWLCCNGFLRYWHFHWYRPGYLSRLGLECNGSVIG